MSGLVSSPTGLWGGRPGLYGSTGLSTSFGLLADVTNNLSLYLDFLDGVYQINGVPSQDISASGITFSRGTNATLIDSTGQLTFAPSNMLLNSEGFGSTSWVKGGTVPAVVTSNTTAAPDGTTTADTVVFAGSSVLRQSVTGIVGVNYSVSIWLRADTPQTLRLLSNTDNSVIASTICSVTTSWQRFSLVRVMPTGATTVSLQLDAVGATAGTYYVWGAQIGAVTYETAPRGYNSTTPKNLLGRTEEFDNAAWVKSSVTVTANSVVDPNGNLNADTFTASGANGTVLQTLTLLAIPYTFSIWLRRKTGTGAINITVDGVTYSTPTITTDWVRYSTTLTPAAGSKTIGVRIVTSGDEVYAWGAQLSDSASLDPYVYNPAAAIVSAAYYGPRFDYSPTTLAPLGLLIEEARTNLLTYSEQFDNAIWTKTASTITSNVIASPSGTITANKLIEDTASSGHWTNQTFAYVSGTTYTYSLYAKASERQYIQIIYLNTSFGSALTAGFDLSGAGATVVSAGATASIMAVGNGWYRCSIAATATVSASSSTQIRVANALSTTPNSYTGNGTSGVYLWGAQLEAGGFATSYIFTAGASVTRSADVATMVGNNFTNWYNQTTGTFAAAFDASANTNATYMSASNGSIVQNSIHIDNDSGNMRAVYYSGSAEQAALGLGAISTVGASNKISTAYAVNDFAASRNGGAVVTDTSGALPVSLTQLNIGTDDRLSAIYYTSGHIKSISYYNTRLTNAQLQAVSA